MIREASSINKVFVRVRKICGNARSTRLIIAAQIKSRKNNKFYNVRLYTE